MYVCIYIYIYIFMCASNVSNHSVNTFLIRAFAMPHVLHLISKLFTECISIFWKDCLCFQNIVLIQLIDCMPTTMSYLLILSLFNEYI